MSRVSREEIEAFKQGGGFDPDWYISTYPDVKMTGMDPAEHYLWIGRNIGRKPKPDDLRMPKRLADGCIVPEPSAIQALPKSFPHWNRAPDGFDARSYLLSNPDLNVLTSIEQLSDHWKKYGVGEARQGSGVSPYSGRLPWRGSLPSRRLRIVYFGPISAQSGLGSAARGYVDALVTLDIDLEVIDTTFSLYPDREGRIVEPAKSPDVVILHQNPDALGNLFRVCDRRILDRAYVIGIWVWELMALRAEWIDAFAAVDEVWAPSDFVTEAVRAAAPARFPVATIPHVVEAHELQSSYSRRDFGIPDHAFTFLSTFDVSSAFERKNPISLLNAFSDLFYNDPTAFLVVKFHSSKTAEIDIAAMRRKYSSCNILFLDRLLSHDKIAALRQLIDCFVSTHRAEGFGLNIAEAMAIGKPVIATAYSGNLTFCNENNSFLVPVSLCEVEKGTPHYSPGAVWAQPDSQTLATIMRKVIADQSLAKRKGEEAARTIEHLLGRKEVSRLMKQSIETIEQKLERGAFDWEKRKQIAWRHPASFGSTKYATGSWPNISVIIPVFNVSAELLDACIESVMNQTYPHWELCICDDASTNSETVAYLDELRMRDQRVRIRRLEINAGISDASNAAVELSTGKFIAFLDNDDTIEPDTLERYAQAILDNPNCDLLYCDEDKIDFSGNYVDHYFKPGWSPDHLESCMYVLHMLVVRKQVFLEIGGYRKEYTGAQDYDLALRISRMGGHIVHVPRLLYHWRMVQGSASAEVDAKPEALSNARRALEDYTSHRYGPDAKVETGLYPGLFRISRGHLVQPPVTLVMTTNNVIKHVDGRGTINLAENFLQSIIELTSYSNYRVIISSNGILSERCRDLLNRIGGIEIVYTGDLEQFNFADKANFSILSAETDFVVLLNDDMEIRSAGWLNALMDHIVKEDVGAVGAHLSYPDNRIQHVGMVVGVNETTAHIYHGHPDTLIGYNGYTSIVRNYSAVTGACMATRRSLYEQVNGFDCAFATDFNDTDYCLRIGQLGYRVVYTPFARLYHFESQTAVRAEQNIDEKTLFASRWQSVISGDPYYNPNLRTDSIVFEPRH